MNFLEGESPPLMQKIWFLKNFFQYYVFLDMGKVFNIKISKTLTLLT